VQKLTNTMQK